jgi:hypothetical protein
MNARPAYVPAGRYRRSPYRAPYRTLVPYGVPIWPGPWLGFSGFDYSDTTGYDDSAITPYSPDYGEGYAPQPAEQQQQSTDVPYQPFFGNSQSSNQPQSPIGEQAVTLVFRDHRPNEVIHNYLLTGTTLTVWDQNPRNIPVNQLDIAATEKTNHDAGVDFYLPGDIRQ